MASHEMIASAYAGRQGVPAYFPASAFAGLMELRGDRGARELLQTAKAIDLPDGEVDVDTMEDLARAEKLFR
jgi:molybdenum cofactor cytidylyltransferase